MSAEIHKLDPDRRSDKNRYQKLIASIRDCLNETLSERLGHMFNSADDTLFQLAESAESNEDQARYFDTMRLLRVERKNIGQRFAAALRACLRSQENQADDELEEDELSLVDQDEMEELVAISTMHSKAMNGFGDSINHLEARLEVLAMKQPGIINKQALIPRHICESFQQALSDIELGMRNKLIIYKLFDQQVMSQLGELYQSLNRILIDADILPQIRLDKTPERKTEYTPPATTGLSGDGSAPDMTGQRSAGGYAPTGSGAGATPAQQVAQGEISRVVNQFIQGEVVARGPGIPASFSLSPDQTAGSGTQFYDRRDILTALSNLQANFIQHNEVTEFVDAETFKRALMLDMGSRHGGTLTRRVNQVDEKTIDFIEMLFEVIVEDNSISDIITNLLLRLQIPVIKVAMLDQKLFESSEHPARRVLNLIAQLGTGINEKDDHTYIRLEHIIDQLLEEFDVDILSFQQAVDELNELIQEELRLTEENEKRTQKQVLQEHARQTVLTELQHVVSSKSLPKAVHPLILKHWSTLLFHQYIRYGKASNQWIQSVNLLRRLLNSLQAIDSRSQWLQLEESHIAITHSIKEALYDTHQDKVKIDESLQALTDTYRTMLETSEHGVHRDDLDDDNIIIDDTGAFDALPEIDAEILEPSPLEEQAREKVARLPADVRPGVWFEIFDGEERPIRRLKLSVIIMEEAKLVFVDRTGIKVLEKDAAIFTEELSNGQSRTIADHSLFDHALSQVINSLAAAC